jgi:predicted aminopeptidase
MTPSLILRLAPVALLLVSLGGCATVSYYTQAVSGQIELLNKRRPIPEVLQDPAVSDDVKRKLTLVQAARDFALRELALPDNGSYTSYADLGRPYAVWNVFAAEEFSVEPRQWCFPVAGCVAYRGYFAKEAAEAFAAELRAQGLEVYVAGVAAYSTLGWFADPVPSTLLARPDPELAALLFHELTHQRLYVADDSEFNESLATVVELEGARRWLQARGEAAAQAAFTQRRMARDEFSARVLQLREALRALYAGVQTVEEKRAARRVLFDSFRRDIATLKTTRWQGYTGFDAWVTTALNNAKLATIGVYYRDRAALEQLLANEGGDFRRFFSVAEALAKLTKDERRQRLAALTVSSVSAAR